MWNFLNYVSSALHAIIYKTITFLAMGNKREKWLDKTIKITIDILEKHCT
jgi:hypothetical protein